jgi:hypothetical protein
VVQVAGLEHVAASDACHEVADVLEGGAGLELGYHLFADGVVGDSGGVA